MVILRISQKFVKIRDLIFLLKVTASFRADIRQTLKSSGKDDLVKAIMELCDDLRDQKLVDLGVRLEDKMDERKVVIVLKYNVISVLIVHLLEHYINVHFAQYILYLLLIIGIEINTYLYITCSMYV